MTAEDFNSNFDCGVDANRDSHGMKGKTLKEILAEKIPIEREKVKTFRESCGSLVVGDVTVDMIYGGMRGMTAMIWETSRLDPDKGILFRGYTIQEILEILPKADASEVPLPEGVFWLLVTGEIPTKAQVDQLSHEWAKRSALPQHVVHLLQNLPTNLHPMSQFCIVVTALGRDSKFARAIADGEPKLNHWESTFEDCMDLIAKLPNVAATIYRNAYKDGKNHSIDPKSDWSKNYTKLLGFDDPKFTELMRLYLSIFSDHDGGNVSAHTSHLVGSALADPYLACAAGITAGAGSLHALAIQGSQLWLQNMQKMFGNNATENQIREFLRTAIRSGHIILGCGHAVLRKTDPRFACLHEFASKYLPDDPLFRLASMVYHIGPELLVEGGKVRNPLPNADALSGVLLNHFGIGEINFHPVLVSVSRSIGIFSQLIWDRALCLPVERPKSITTAALKKLVGYKL